MKAWIKPGAAAAVFVCAFFVYINTLNPAFHANDSPETIACAYTLGIQHPPGYPLFSVAGKIFSFLPAGNTGFRINTEAAFFGALTAMFMFFIIIEVLRKKNSGFFPAGLIAVCASLFYAFSYTSWSEALSAKGGIYTMNSFFMALIIFTLFLWERKYDKRFLYLAGLVYGLSLANHWESMAVASPAFILYLFFVLKKNNKSLKSAAGPLGISALFAVSGLFVYAFLYIRAKHGAVLNWGNPDTLKKLMDVIFREQYAALEKAKGFSVVAGQVSRIAAQLYSEYFIPGLAAAAAGIVGFIAINKREKLIFISVMTVSYLLALSFYFNLKSEMLWIIDVFLIPVYMGMAVFFAAGLYYVWLQSSKFKTQNVKLYRFVVILLIVSFPVMQLARNYEKADQSGYYYGYDFGMNVIKSIELPAIAMLEGDFYVMPQLFFKFVKKKTEFCPVTTLFMYKDWGLNNVKNQCPEIKVTAGPQDSLAAKIENVIGMNYRERNIYVSVFRSTLEEFYPGGNAMLKPAGIMMKFATDPKNALAEAEVNIKKMSLRDVINPGVHMNATTQLCVSNYSSGFMETGQAFRAAGNYEKAEYYLKRGVETATPKTKAQSLVHLGILYAMKKDYEEALKYYSLAIKENPEMAEAYSNLAGVYNETGKYGLAIEMSEKAIKCRPGFSEAYNNLAVAYYKKGDRAKAVEVLEKAVRLNPGNAAAKANLLAIKGERK